MAMQKDDRSWQLIVVVNDELKISHGLIPLVCNGCMLSAHSLVGFVHLIDNMRYLAQIAVQPGSILKF